MSGQFLCWCAVNNLLSISLLFNYFILLGLFISFFCILFFFSIFLSLTFFYFKRWPYNAKAFPSTRTYLSKVNYYLQKNLFCCMVVWRCLQLYVYYMYTVSKKAVHLWYSIICGVHGRAWLSGPRGPEFSSGSGSLYSYMQVSLTAYSVNNISGKHRGFDGVFNLWPLANAGLETLSISRCLNHW